MGSLHTCKQYLSDPKPYKDIRLDSHQMSLSEYDDELTPNGDINLVEIYIRAFADDPEYYGRFKKGIETVLANIKK